MWGYIICEEFSMLYVYDIERGVFCERDVVELIFGIVDVVSWIDLVDVFDEECE